MNLFPSHRLDLIIKYLYFKRPDLVAFKGDETVNIYERMYKQHIMQRTGAQEKATSKEKDLGLKDKTSIEDYITRAEELKSSMLKEGFKKEHEVSVYECGAPLNGAHRIACAKALGIDPVYKVVKGKGLKWDFYELSGFLDMDCMLAIMHEWARLNSHRSTFLVSWNPAQEEQLFKELDKKNINVVYSGYAHTLLEGEEGLRDLAFRLYAPEEAVFKHVIEEKAKDLIREGNSNIAIKCYLLEDRDPKINILDYADDFKEELRAKIKGRSIPSNNKNGIHMASNVNDNLWAAGVFLNRTSILRTFLMYNTRTLPSETLNKWLVKLSKVLRDSGINREDVCIVGSSVLDGFGLRESTDIDLIVHSKLRPKFGDGNSKLDTFVDIARTGYHKIHKDIRLHRSAQKDDYLIEDPNLHYRYWGFKFAHPNVCIDRKREQGRPKDLKDVKAMDALLKKMG